MVVAGRMVDVLQSVRTNTVKEVKEETGLDVKAVRLIALQDRNKHNVPVYAYGVCKVFVLCELIGGEFTENVETTEIAFFDVENLPANPAKEKNTEQQIKMCFEAYEEENWQPYFD